jgi:predicted transglutaminase-like cysteine proteinase
MFALGGATKPVVISCALALLVSALGVACATDALADSRDVADSFSSASLQQPSSLAPSPARFFTINAVLAKHDNEQLSARQALATSPQNTPDQPTGMTSDGPEPFGLYSFKAPDGILWRKWRGVEADIDRDKILLEYCEKEPESCPGYAAQFLRLIKAAKSKSKRDQLDEVNRGVNIAIRYVSDMIQYGEADRWSAPLATFASGKGDCEDFAIAKYVVLREAGIPADNLRIVLVRDQAIQDDHAVVAVRHDGRWLIMDNRYSNLMSANLVSDGEALSFTPLFAINDRGVHLFAASYADRSINHSENDATPAAAPPQNDRVAGDGSNLGFALGAMPLLI